MVVCSPLDASGETFSGAPVGGSRREEDTVIYSQTLIPSAGETRGLV